MDHFIQPKHGDPREVDGCWFSRVREMQPRGQRVRYQRKVGWGFPLRAFLSPHFPGEITACPITVAGNNPTSLMIAQDELGCRGAEHTLPCCITCVRWVMMSKEVALQSGSVTWPGGRSLQDLSSPLKAWKSSTLTLDPLHSCPHQGAWKSRAWAFASPSRDTCPARAADVPKCMWAHEKKNKISQEQVWWWNHLRWLPQQWDVETALVGQAGQELKEAE